MQLWEATLWGAFGGFAVEGLEFRRALVRVNTWPWRAEGEVGLGPYATSVFLRIVVGSGLAAAGAGSGQLPTAISAIAVGVAAPLIMENFARTAPQLMGVPAAMQAPAEAGSSTPAGVAEAEGKVPIVDVEIIESPVSPVAVSQGGAS